MSSRLFCIVVVMSLCANVVGCHGPRQRPEATPWLEFEWPEADLLFQRDQFWVGGDGAYSIDLGEDRVLWLFGDSWIDMRGNGSRDEATMVSNSLAVQSGYNPAQAEIDFFWGTTTDGKAQAFFPNTDGIRYWPGHGIRVADRLLLFLMEVRSSDEGLGFKVASWKAVLVTNPDEDPPAWNLKWLDTPANERRIIVGSGGVLHVGQYIYAFGSDESSAPQYVYLVRWLEESARQGDLQGIEWWGGPDGWIRDRDGGLKARPVFSEGQTEFTVHYDGESGSFTEIQTVGFGAAFIVRRTAPELTGPWSVPNTIFNPAQIHFPRIMVYQGKAHPHLEGADLVLTYCTNSFDFADQLAEPWLYYPRFVRVSGP